MVGNKDNLDQESKRFLIEGTEKKAEELSKLLDEFFASKKDLKDNRMFALYGGWGTGKTTLLEETEKKLKNDYKIVWFKPWEYDDEGKDLDLKLLTLIQDKISLPFLKKISSYLMNLIKNYLGIWLVLSTLLFFTIIFSEKIEKINTQIDNFWVLVNNYDLLYIVISVLFLGLISLPVAWYLMKSFTKIGVNFNMGPFNLNMNSQDFIQNIKHGIKKSDTIKNKYKKILGTNKVIVFVDDLDRCQGETVLNLMEHIKHFYSVDKILFVFAIDQEKLAQYVVNKYGYKSNDNSMLIDKVTHIKYKQLDSKNDYDQYGYINNNFSLKEGYAYLDKFFPSNDRLSWSSEVRNFMTYLYKKNGIDEYIQEIEEPIKLTEDIKKKMLDLGIGFQDNNPLTLFQIQEMFFQCVEFYAWFNFRKIENLVNKFANIYKKFGGAYFIYSEGILISIDQIFRYYLVEEFYPDLLEGANSREKIIYSDVLRYKVENEGYNRHLIKNPHMSIETILKFKDIPDGNHTNGIMNLQKKECGEVLEYDEFKLEGLPINQENSYILGLFQIDTTTIEPINHDIVNRIDVLKDRTLLEKLKTIKCVSVK